MRAPTAIDLFAGCGGLTQGLKQAGFAVLAAVEINSLACESYEANHPEVKVLKIDIVRLSATKLLKELGLRKGELDLLSGCPPCQAFSSMRSLNGSKRVRDKAAKDLLFEFLRFVRVLEPKALMLENVPGLKKDRRFSRFKSALGRLGYEITSKTLNCSHFGVPQRRRRLILVGSRLGRAELAEPTKARETVRGAFKTLGHAGRSGDPLHDIPEKRSRRVQALIAKIPPNGGSRSDLPVEMQLACHIKCDGFKDVYGRMKWDAVSPTITTGCFNPSKGRFLHPEEHRAITLREAAALQTFPAKYFFSLKHGKTGAATLIGNALPPRFIEMHAARVRSLLEESQ